MIGRQTKEFVYDQLTNYLEKRAIYPTPLQKDVQQVFLGCTGPHFGPTNTNHTKNYQKITLGVLFSLPPQNALQCTKVQCNVL